MSTNERVRRYRRDRYLNVNRDSKENISGEGMSPLEYKQHMRRLLRERRCVVGPNGEQMYIPGHASMQDTFRVMEEEYGLNRAETAGLLVVLKRLSKDQEFCGKVNRVVANGIQTPLRIVRPPIERKASSKEESTIPFDSKAPESANTEISTKNNNTQIYDNSKYRVDEEEYRKRAAEINAAKAERFRKAAELQREEDKRREAQSADLQKQMDEYLEEEKRWGIHNKTPLKVIAIFSALYLVGMFSMIGNLGKNVTSSTPNATKLSTDSQDKNGFPSMSTPYSELTNNQVQATPYATPSSTKSEKQTSIIAGASEGLRKDTRLYNTIQQYSESSKSPVTIGEISSFEQFEDLLKTNDDILFSSGPVFFEDFSRDVIHSMIKDRYNTDKILATYEKKGSENQIYEFYIRYYSGSSDTPFTREGRVNMTRNSAGRLETDETHTFSYDVYESLAMIGELSNYRNNDSQVSSFDLNRYAAENTGGDLELAKRELKEKMTYGIECLKNILQYRVREDQISEYTSGR